MSQTAQTWAIASSTIVAALLGVIVTFIGTSHQQRAQAAREARTRQDAALAELLAAAQDFILSARAIWITYADRNVKWMMFRWMATFHRAYILMGRADPTKLPPPLPPFGWRWFKPQNPLPVWRLMARQFSDVNIIGALLDIDHQMKDYQRKMMLDMATILNPKLTRYFAVAALLTFGEDKEIANSVRNLTSKITAVPLLANTSREEVERVSSEALEALDELRAEANRQRS